MFMQRELPTPVIPDEIAHEFVEIQESEHTQFMVVCMAYGICMCVSICVICICVMCMCVCAVCTCVCSEVFLCVHVHVGNVF